MDTTLLPKTRAEAKAVGAPYYFTGLPCKHGHIAPRKTKGACLECLKNEWDSAKVKRADYFAAYNKSEAGKKAKARYYTNNKDLVKARANNADPEAKRLWRAKYAKANPEQIKSYVNMRRRRFRQATPTWLTKEDKLAIRAVYLEAARLTRSTGERYAVDHIVPLQGATVSGLHVPWNLQVLRHTENSRKSNRLLADDGGTCHNPNTGNPYLPA